jgi:hypothetical protein
MANSRDTPSNDTLIDPADPADPHHLVPLDAAGNPVFLFLPPGVLKGYHDKLSRCEHGWKVTRDPVFLAEALIHVHLYRQPPPLWLSEAAVALVLNKRTAADVKRAMEAGVHRLRFETLRAAKEDGIRWMRNLAEHAGKVEAAKRASKDYAAAALAAENAAYWRAMEREAVKLGRVTWPMAGELAVRSLAAAGDRPLEPETVRKSYDQVKADLKAGRGGLYLMRHMPRRNLREVIESAAKQCAQSKTAS